MTDKHQAILEGWLWLPLEMIQREMHDIRTFLTFQPRNKMDGTRPDPVLLYQDDGAWIGVPQAWGMERFGHLIEVEDRTTTGSYFASDCTWPDPNHPAVKDPEAQAKFIADMYDAAKGHKRFIAMAPTGTGKTVVGAMTAAWLGRKTLVLSHMDRINAQWISTFRDMLGVPVSRIGEMQGGKCTYHDKDVVIGTLQTVAREPLRFPPDFYAGFGTIIFDEVHRCGAPVFSQAVWQFPAAYRIGLTAQIHRKDGAETIFTKHIGPVRVTSEQQALPIEVWPRWYSSRRAPWGDSHGARIKCLTQDEQRNRVLVKIIMRMHAAGRNTLIVSETVAHLQRLMAMCARAGMPKSDVGQFTATVHEKKKERVGGRTQDVLRTRKQSGAALEHVKATKQMLFATYGMIKEGVDVPRLDGGVDATPRTDALQLIGRLRRPHPGKRSPILWVTMVDSNCSRSLGYYEKRLVEYEEAGAIVKDR